MWSNRRNMSLKVVRKLPSFISWNKTCENIFKRWLLKWITRKEEKAFFRCHLYFAEREENSNESGIESFDINIFIKCGIQSFMFEPEHEKQSSLVSELL